MKRAITGLVVGLTVGLVLGFGLPVHAHTQITLEQRVARLEQRAARLDRVTQGLTPKGYLPHGWVYGQAGCGGSVATWQVASDGYAYLSC